MRILLVNTSEQTGGAAVATRRLLFALNNNGEKAKMLVRDKQTDNISVVEMPHRRLNMLHFLWERMRVFLSLRFSMNHLWDVDIANSGVDITSLPEFREADVVHLAWVNQGMLSLSSIEKILKSGKPVVWTMHDLWPATSICHYARGCEQFHEGCHNCRLLPGGGSANDLSSHVWKRKSALYNGSGIHFVTCSRWLEKQARKSGLLDGMSLTSIPNPIDTHIFYPYDKKNMRKELGLPLDKKVILFVAQKVTDERKGASYLVDAINKMVRNDSQLRDNAVVALLGGHSEELAEQISIPSYPLGYISGETNLAKVYSAADVFVLPSLEDNLPNTLMEALACGVPCVGFAVGGIPEMIDHKINGYVARMGDVDDLTNGLGWVLSHAEAESLSHAALAKVGRCYSQQSVANKYIEVYTAAMAQKRYRL